MTPARTNARSWARDLTLGARLAVTGGRESWVRLLLTGVGVGLGVALLLLTTAIPNALSARDDRERARGDLGYTQATETHGDAATRALLIAETSTTYRDHDIRGRLLRSDGPRPPLPPGVSDFPAPGEMVVSPSLKGLLESDEGELLRDRLPYRISGTVGDAGLTSPNELAYYAGSDEIEAGQNGVQRITAFHPYGPYHGDGLDPVLLLLVVVVVVALLTPVGVFVATAVRFGGERRDRRLAALRLVGADRSMTRRIAAGEALVGAVLGLFAGALFFAWGRTLAGRVEVYGQSIFPHDLDPSWTLAALVALAVPAASVAVTLMALRGVVVEPLGVVRSTRPTRRRLWWRLLLPLGGLALLYPMVGQGHDNGEFNEELVIGGTVLLLVGVTALLPWIVEAVVTRLGSGGVSWQLAVRRLQLNSGTAARMVNGVAVAVASAIALQMLFTGVEGDYTVESDSDLTRAQVQIYVRQGVSVDQVDRQVARSEGVRRATVVSVSSLGGRRGNSEDVVDLTIGGCSALREVARLPSCSDGDVFVVHGAENYADTPRIARPGRMFYADPGYGEDDSAAVPWRLPLTAKKAGPRPDPTGWENGGILATPSALPREVVADARAQAWVQLDTSVPDAVDLVRNSAARLDPLTTTITLTESTEVEEFASIRTGLFVGAACVLALIGASLLVTQLEQLRERRKLLSTLVAFGTRRRTLGLSVLWQTAVPVALGLLLASAVGLVLGGVLLRMVAVPVTVDWSGVLTMTAVGAGVVLAVTALSIPPLLRMTRPDGLRTE